MDTGKPMPMMERNHVKSSFRNQLRGFCKAHFISSLCVSSLGAWSSWFPVVLVSFLIYLGLVPGSFRLYFFAIRLTGGRSIVLTQPGLSTCKQLIDSVPRVGGLIRQMFRADVQVMWPGQSDKLTLSWLPSLILLSTYDLWVIFDLWLEKNI